MPLGSHDGAHHAIYAGSAAINPGKLSVGVPHRVTPASSPDEHGDARDGVSNSQCRCDDSRTGESKTRRGSDGTADRNAPDEAPSTSWHIPMIRSRTSCLAECRG